MITIMPKMTFSCGRYDNYAKNDFLMWVGARIEFSCEVLRAKDYSVDRRSSCRQARQYIIRTNK